jgi:preprotein translocase subunit SecG
MTAVLLVIHLILAFSLVVVVLLQRSEGGALGIGGGTMGGLMTTRGSANLLTRATGVIAACFIVSSISLAILASADREPTSILDQPAATAPLAPAAPAKPAGPTVPLGR